MIKGALRRVFARSELRKNALGALRPLTYFDPKRPRVSQWVTCPHCQLKTPKYLMIIDHHDPVIPIYTSLEAMSWDEVIDRMWCDPANLRPLCKECHAKKTKQERNLRKMYKKH